MGSGGILQRHLRACLNLPSGTSPFSLNSHKPLITQGAKDTDEARLKPFRVGEWRVLPELNELQRGDERLRVQPRLIQLLRLLAVAGGRTVSRETLLASAWSRRMVNDEVLSRTIADLRQALGDDARAPRYLETIPKVGYRLLAAVDWLETTVPGVPATMPAAQPPPAPLLAAEPAPAPAPRRSLRLATGLAAIAVATAALGWLLRPEAPADIAAPWRESLLKAQPLTSDPGWELAPRLANRSDLIAYSEAAPGSDTATIRLRSHDGRIARALTDGTANDLCPVFSPDDAEVLWTRHRDGACELLRAPVLGGAPVHVADCAPGVLSCPDWVGDQVVYTAPAAVPEHGPGLARLHLGDGRRESLTAPPQGHGSDTHPRIDSTGRIVYARGAEGDRSLRLREADGSERRIEFPASMLYGADFLPDGRVLAASDALGFRALVAIDPATGRAALLGARGARYPDVADDGRLVFENASYDANLWLYEAGTEPVRLTASTRYDAYPRLAPEGQRLAYQSNRDGAESIYLLDLVTRSESRLPLDPAMRWAQPAWSPDGRALLLTRYAPGGIDLWRLTLGAERPQPLADAPAGAHDAQFDPDGVHAWCRVGAERDAALWRFRLDGAAPPERMHEAVEHYQVDAQGLFLVKVGDPRLYRCDPHSCAPLLVELATGHRRNWAISADAVYYVGADNADAAVDRMALVDGARSRSAWPRPGALSRAIDVSRDGRRAVIARTDRVDVDLLWVGPRAD